MMTTKRYGQFYLIAFLSLFFTFYCKPTKICFRQTDPQFGKLPLFDLSLSVIFIEHLSLWKVLTDN